MFITHLLGCVLKINFTILIQKLSTLQRCMERLRSSRSQLVNRFRSAGDAINNNNNSPAKMVQDIMEIEWAAISQGSVFPSLKYVILKIFVN